MGPTGGLGPFGRGGAQEEERKGERLAWHTSHVYQLQNIRPAGYLWLMIVYFEPGEIVLNTYPLTNLLDGTVAIG